MLNQDRRLIQAQSPLGADAFIVTHLSGNERISDLFQFSVSILSDNHEIEQKDLVGKALSLKIHYEGASKDRIIHAYVNGFSKADVDPAGLRAYSLTLVPGLWFTSLSSNNRVFHEKDSVKIIEEVLGEYSSFVKLSKKLSGKYLTKEYCVQYEETDYAFIMRLLAEEGIAFYFKHSDSGHELVLVDEVSGFYDCEAATIPYSGGGSDPMQNSIVTWRRNTEYHIGGVEFTDYNEYAPAVDNKQTDKTDSQLNDVNKFVMRHHGMYKFQKDKETTHKFDESYNKDLLAKLLEANEQVFDTANGISDCSVFSAGGKFGFEHSALKTENGKYLLVSVNLTVTDSNKTDSSYTNEFICVPEMVMPRPMAPAHKAKIYHPQTATIKEVRATAAASSKDEYTQVKVIFPWNSAQNSCWVRVAQSYAGKNWGANFVPRIGQEVIVTYIDGDVDRPIVTGALYNGTNVGPNYTATQSGWKSIYEDSAFNELRFDDKPGEEEIYLEAGKDRNILIHNDESTKIENDQSLEVKNNRTITILEGNEATTVSKGNQTYKVDSGNHELKVSKGTQTTTVKGAIKITSNTSIKLVCGGSSIEMTPSGITIKGIQIEANGSASTTVKGGGTLTLKGGVTLIN